MEAFEKVLDKIPAAALRRLFRQAYRKRDEVRRLYCTHEDYSDAWIDLPTEWLGKHALLKEDVTNMMEEQATAAGKKVSPEATNVAVALVLVEGFGKIPGIHGENPRGWKIEEIPIPIIAWLTDVVTSDFMSAYQVPLPFVEDSGEQLPAKEPKEQTK